MTKEIIYKLLDVLPQFFNKDSNTTNYQFLYSLALELETTETAISDLSDDIFVDTSTGQYLNDLAAFFRLIRKADETDEDLRARIKAHWTSVGGGGTTDSIRTTVANVFSIPLSQVTVYESDFMKVSVIISTDEPVSDATIDTMNTLLDKTVAAGIWVDASYSISNGLSEGISIAESVSITESTTGIFTAGVSLAGGSDVA